MLQNRLSYEGGSSPAPEPSRNCEKQNDLISILQCKGYRKKGSCKYASCSTFFTPFDLPEKFDSELEIRSKIYWDTNLTDLQRISAELVNSILLSFNLGGILERHFGSCSRLPQ